MGYLEKSVKQGPNIINKSLFNAILIKEIMYYFFKIVKQVLLHILDSVNKYNRNLKESRNLRSL